MTKFHSKTVNGVLQELYAIAIMNVIACTLVYISSKDILEEKHVFQFKDAVFALSADIGFLVLEDPEMADVRLYPHLTFTKQHARSATHLSGFLKAGRRRQVLSQQH